MDRPSELEANGLRIERLDAPASASAWNIALGVNSADHYGLRASAVVDVERHAIVDLDATTRWLERRLSMMGADLLLVFSQYEVFRISKGEFLGRWFDCFVPARDDAIVLEEDGPGVLFYCHEEEFEAGRRHPARG